MVLKHGTSSANLTKKKIKKKKKNYNFQLERNSNLGITIEDGILNFWSSKHHRDDSFRADHFISLTHDSKAKRQ